jgi:hypothetical protein
LCKAIDNYLEFLDFYKETIRRNKKNKENSTMTIISLLIEEEQLLTRKNIDFESKLYNELHLFSTKYQNKFTEMLKKFDDLLKELTNEEHDILKDFF